MNDNERFELLYQEGKKRKLESVEAAKKNAVKIGKELFDLSELKKYWAYRFEKGLSEEELAEDMKKIEEDYYLDDRFKTMESYGKYLMKMELYS